MSRIAILVLTALMVAPTPIIAQPDDFAPLEGVCKGEWKITQGTDDIGGKFRVTFGRAAPIPEGSFRNLELTRTRLDGKRSAEKVKVSNREMKVEKLQAISAEPPRYRWFAAGNCWNAEIKAGLMEGFFNAGPCSNMGMGAGARAVEFVAKKAG